MAGGLPCILNGAMLTQLATVKARLNISPADTTQDDLLTRAIAAVSARFDQECNRTFARTVGLAQEFRATDREIIAECYPVETVTKFEAKRTEAEGWVEQTGADYLLRQGCIITLTAPLCFASESLMPAVARVTYTGGCVLPGTAPSPGQTALPADVETAAVEQVAVWYQNRDKLGLIRHWPSSGTYLVLSQLPLLPQVTAMIRPYRRWAI